MNVAALLSAVLILASNGWSLVVATVSQVAPRLGRGVADHRAHHAGDRRRQHEGNELVAHHGHAECLGGLFVLAQRHGRSVTGGALWVIGLILVGYLFGNIPFVKQRQDMINWTMILIPA